MASRLRTRTKRLAEEVKEHAKKSADTSTFSYTPSDSDIFVSTGCTLLDLAISGGRVRGGGIPGGLMIEVYGGPGAGKTALAMEISASVQAKGGEIEIADPEARLDQQYTKVYGVNLSSDSYSRPDIVMDVKNEKGKVVEKGLESIIKNWDPQSTNCINVLVADSIAALSTSMEMGKGDKRGQKKAKDLHALCRTTARLISKDNRLVVFTNQLTAGDWGEDSPGGVAIKFYASLRLQIKQKKMIAPEKKNEAGKIIKKVIGIESEIYVKKSSVDDPYRSAPMYLMFGSGIDDVRGNLQYAKDMSKDTSYDCIDGKTYVAMNAAIKYIEDNDLESDLRERVIDIWEANEKLFKVSRKKKIRF